MRKLFLLILALLLLAGPAAAYDVLILQSRHGETYDETVRGFQSVCATGSRVIVTSDYADIDLPRIIREDKPRVVVTIGDNALAAAKAVTRTPVIALKARTLTYLAKSRKNVTGIRMSVPAEQFLVVLRELDLKNVGVIFNEEESGAFIQRSNTLLQNNGFVLVAKEIDRPGQLLDALSALKGKIDGLWIIPDRVVATRENAETFFQFTLNQQIPLVSYSAAHLDFGAAAAVDVDHFEMGRQGGEMARKVLQGTSPADIPPAAPRKVTVKKNPQVLKRLGMAAGSPSSTKTP